LENDRKKEKCMKKEDCLLGLHELMKVAEKTDTLAREDWEESKAHRITGRLVRDPDDVGASCYATVEGVKKRNAFFLELTGGQDGWLLLQISMEQVSYAIWEQLWNEAHPDRFGEAWEGEDFDLMSVWRQKVRAMIKECDQEAILDMTVEEYYDQITATGEIEEVAEALAGWISVIHEEDTPST
jgi:hypothetical protein